MNAAESLVGPPFLAQRFNNIKCMLEIYCKNVYLKNIKCFPLSYFFELRWLGTLLFQIREGSIDKEKFVIITKVAEDF
jgi:hypothetical protein